MPLVSQQGEVAQRLRNFFRITGRIPSTVDETVVPTSQLQNLDQPPFRSDVADYRGRVLKGAVALRFSLVGNILRAPGVAVVDSVWIRNGNGAGLSYTLHLLDNAEADPTFLTPSFTFNVEHIQPIRSVPPELATIDLAATLVSNELWGGIVPALTSLYVPLRVTLRRNRGGSSQGLWLQGRTANVEVEASFSGTFYPETV